MKVKVNNEKDFKPIELTITIESKEELNEVYARFNVQNHVLNENYCGFNIIPTSEDSTTDEVFSVLSKICQNL